ncbi:adenylate/guanylate cyclase domain-containing protein [Candidatus Venteria ishoeyi]|uniref:Adenylate cyclase 1 n=1 Tax=Candidatus Venteria ishoeyi TaxID=1899563 RepID=A0A1H6FB25_9GAMM|nr:adenylate/guanylate cyclase domain-containing protein [Candidatus Venteria ishoeyi]MDM8545396.1 adenylate/guanylate cyclase domain-containing protein [Candidatus Venteria ishoeyi]SEH07287.1 Adenylate cyclase 1 [Candidatus Venteria ishoeyi]
MPHQALKFQGRILIIAQAAVDLAELAYLLKQQGYNTNVATTLQASTAQLEGHLPDLILLSMQAPGGDAKLWCDKLKASAAISDIPIILLLSAEELKNRQLLFAKGCVDYLLRPFQSEEILARVGNHMMLYHLKKNLPNITQHDDLSRYVWMDAQRLEEKFAQLLHNSMELEERVKARTQELAQLNRVYERFVPREFLDFLKKRSIIEVHPGDQIHQEMTVMFMDIRDFTFISEQLTPQQTFNFLNEWLSQTSPVIRKYRGFIDKYIGDAVMALFPHGPEHALQAAIHIRKNLSRFNIKQRAQGKKPIDIGIGIHTGRLMLGIIGDRQRMQSTVIADAVNLAARLEGLTKIYGANIAISKYTLLRILNPKNYNFRSVGKIRLKGKKNAVSVYEVLDGCKEKELRLKMKTRSNFEKGLNYYQKKKFAEASMQFHQALEAYPDDKAARLYLTRSAQYLVNGVPDDWEGIEVMETK